MNILFCYPTLFHPMRGGIERVTDILARELLRRGYNVFYLHNKRDESLMDYDYPAPVSFFPEVDFRDNRNVPFYHDFLTGNAIDIVVNQCGNFSDSILYLNVPAGVKTISVLHSNPLLNYAHLPSEVLKLRKRTFMEYLKLAGRFILYPRIKRVYLESCKWQVDYLSSHTDVICLLSGKFKPEMELLSNKNNIGTVFHKIRVIPNPNTYEIKDDAKFNKEKILLYVGRLDKGQKRPDRLLKIWRKLYRRYPDWQMAVVGDGPEKSSLVRKSRDLERISFVGFQEPGEWYRRSAIFCMTSNFEGWGMVLVEAMAHGVVPLAFDSYASVHDIIDDGRNGFLVTPFSINEYAEKLAKLMDDDAQRERMSRNCLHDVQQYSKENIVNKWEQLFKELKS